MDNEDDVDVDIDDEGWGTDGDAGGTPLLSESGGRGRARGRGRRKPVWDDQETSRRGQLSLLEVGCAIARSVWLRRLAEPADVLLACALHPQLIPPLILSHPLFLLPIIPLLPNAFLPAGVIIFVPAIVAIAGLSACANIVAVYLAR
jgi:hypothetical protein